MESTNLAHVRSGLDICGAVLKPYAGDTVLRFYGDSASQVITNVLWDQSGLCTDGDYAALIDSLRLIDCLRLIDRGWDEIFSRCLNSDFHGWIKEIINIRNAAAHMDEEDLDKPYTERSLDTMARVCGCVDTQAGNQVRQLYYQARNAGASVAWAGAEQPTAHTGSASGLLGLVGTDAVQKTNLSRKVTFHGKTQAYPVYRVRLDLLFYNDQNDRIATWLSRYNAEHGAGALHKLSREEYNTVIEGFIFDSNPAAIQKTQKSIQMVGQRESGVALPDGRIVDGNRRFTCLRRIARDSGEPVWFETVIVDVDMETDQKQIKLLELAIQHGEEKKVDYDLIDFAVGTYNDIERTHLLTIEEYASSTGETVADVKKRLEAAHMITDFLIYIGIPEQYHVARDYQVYSVIWEMLPLIKQVPEEYREDLKATVFHNSLLQAALDQRKFIRDIKLLFKAHTFDSYFTELRPINAEIHAALVGAPLISRDTQADFARRHKDLAERMRQAMERALQVSRSTQLLEMPGEKAGKSLAMLADIDLKLIGKLDADQRELLSARLTELESRIAAIRAAL